jgi:hypothetical protein
MTETDRMRTNDLKLNKAKLVDSKSTKSARGISLDNDHKAIDGLSKLITQTSKNSENSSQTLKFTSRNDENANIKSLSPEKNFNIDYLLPPQPLSKVVNIKNFIFIHNLLLLITKSLIKKHLYWI